MVLSPLTDSYVMPLAQNHFCRSRTVDIRKPEACNWTGKIIYQNLMSSWFNVTTSIAKNNFKASPSKRNNSKAPLLAHFCVCDGIFFLGTFLVEKKSLFIFIFDEVHFLIKKNGKMNWVFHGLWEKLISMNVDLVFHETQKKVLRGYR